MLRPRLASVAAIEPGGLWRLSGDARPLLLPLRDGTAQRATLLVPTSQLLLLAVDLPLAGLRRRAEALPFAVEDRIGAPLASVHVALGQEIAPQRHLAAVVAHDRMAAWLDALAEAGLEDAALVPDVLAIAAPPSGWRVAARDGAALVRTAEGGFAIPPADLSDAWRLAGEPAVEAEDELGAALPGAVRVAAADAPLSPPPLDLRQGAYAARRRGPAPVWRRIAAVALIGLGAHALIAAADTAALAHLAARHATAARSLLASAAPDADPTEDLSAAAAALVPASGAGGSAFLPLLSRVGTALRGHGTAATLRSLSFDASAGTMSIEVDAADMDALGRVSGALSRAGLSAQSGASSSEGGRAVGSFLVKAA